MKIPSQLNFVKEQRPEFLIPQLEYDKQEVKLQKG